MRIGIHFGSRSESRSRARRFLWAVLLAAACMGWPAPARSVPAIVAADVVRLEVIASDPAALADVDMLEFDSFGNLFANRETTGFTGGTSFVDVPAGTATIMVSSISRADGIALHPSGAFYVTSELSGASTTARIFRVDVVYDAGDRPLSATRTSITTNLGINNPEGIVCVTEDGKYGPAGTLYVCEDTTPGRVFRVTLGSANTAVVVPLVNTGANLRRPEGLAYGEFLGAQSPPALFTAETSDHNVLRILSNGAVSVVGNPAGVSLIQPDNVRFGPDGKLYVTEDLNPGRVIRISLPGIHQVVLSGFNYPQGMAFDVARRDLYIAEQGADTVWRARFQTATGDVDGDSDADLVDVAAFQRCASVPFGGPECLRFDYDRDDDADLVDFDPFHLGMTGP